MARWRHFLVAILIVPALLVYISLALWLADWVTGRHWALDLLFYLLAGLIWIPPAGWVTGWLAKYEAK